MSDPLTNNFNLHLLFDPYIASNLGNSPHVAFRYFDDSMTSFLSDNKDQHFVKPTLELLKNSLDISRKLDKFLDKLAQLYDVDPLDRGENAYRDNLSNLLNSKVAKALKIPFSFRIDKPVFDEKTYKPSIELYIRTILKYVVDNNVLSNNTLIVPSGYDDRTKHSGHAIGIYYNKVDAENYTVTIANSGEGINLYHPRKESKFEVIIEKNNISLHTLSSLLIENYLAAGVFDKKYTIQKYYERVLLPYISPLRSDVPNEMYYQYPQISGSCTFFGFFYIFLYYFLKQDKKQLFTEWHLYAKNQATEEILQHLISKKRITSSDKNFLDLLKNIRTDSSKEKITLAEAKYISDVEDWTTIPKEPSTFTFEYPLNVKKSEKSPNPFIEYIPLIKSIQNSTNLSSAIEAFTKLVTIASKLSSAFHYTGIIYLLIRSLLSIYTKEDRILKQLKPREFFAKLPPIITELNKIKWLGERTESYASSYISNAYKLQHTYLLIFNIILKVNTLADDKYLLATPGSDINPALFWIIINYKFDELYGLTPYDLALNMKDYQHYFPSYYNKNKDTLLSKSVIESWSHLIDPLLEKSPTAPIILTHLQLDKNKPDWDKLKDDPIFPSNFLHLISSEPYNFLFYLMLNLFFGGSEYMPIEYFISIQSTYTAPGEGKAYEFVLKSNGGNAPFGRERAPHHENDINIFEMTKFSDIQDTKLILNHYEYPNIFETSNKIFTTIDTTYILYNDDVKSFSLPPPDNFKCQVEKLDWERVNLTNIDLKMFSIILFNYKCSHKEIPPRILELFQRMITQYANELEASNIEKEIEKAGYKSGPWYTPPPQEKDIINAKIIYILLTGNLDHEYMQSILTGYILYKIPYTFYRKFCSQLFNDIDKVVPVFSLWQSIQVDQYRYFINLFKELNLQVQPHGTTEDEIFGNRNLYDIITPSKTKYQIALLSPDYFKDFTYINTPKHLNLSNQYIFYRDQTTKKIFGITNTKHLPNIEILITNPDTFTVFKKGTPHKYIQTLKSGLAKNFYDKLIRIVSDNILISHNEKEDDTLITLTNDQSFKIQRKKIFYQNYELITDKYNFAQNQFIYDLPTAFLLKKDLDHKILLITCHKCTTAPGIYKIDDLFRSVWINSNTPSD
ncbi:MAG: hypothetical protein Hyperionvirus35_1, partial [Hyperionvirus sp.]